MPARPSVLNLLEALNPSQREAVEAVEGPVLVLAGAGTGKTRVITTRIAYLMSRRVPAEAILAMTFTNKAAGEMRERVGALVGPKRSEGLTVGTFHAFCLGLLREHKKLLGYPRGFTICDAADQLAVIKGVLRELHIPEANLRPPALLARISLAKNRLETPEGLLEKASDDLDELVGRAWRRYTEALERSRRLDFDDLLLRALGLMRDHPRVRAALEKRFRFVLVDEYQDTNGVQYEILSQIAGGHRNLCVVGDDDQSIYGWRGADVRKILGFETDYPGAKVVRLETNYRSTREILKAANRLIEHNPARHPKTLHSAAGGGANVRAIACRDENVEAETVVGEILQLVERKEALFSDFAILLRTAIQPRPFEAELRMKQIPYILVGGMSFFDRKEVRDVLAYLRLVANPDDETSLLRILNSPPRGVGKRTIERALAFATEKGLAIGPVFDRGEEIEDVNLEAVATVQRLRATLSALSRKRSLMLAQLVERVLLEVDYKSEVQRCHPDPQEFEQRWAAVGDVINWAHNYEQKRAKPDLGGFLNDLSLTAADKAEKGDPDNRDNGGRRAVTLMTLHASKGLEFRRVYLVGLEEGLLPHARAAAEDSIEEERRLAYVGITRAREHLSFTHALERTRYGRGCTSHPSRFLFEVKGETPPANWVAAGTEQQTVPAKKGRRKARRKGARKTSRKSARKSSSER